MEVIIDSAGETKKTDRWRLLTLLLAILSLFILYNVFGIGQQLGFLREWIKGLGAWGPIVFVAFCLLVMALHAAGYGSLCRWCRCAVQGNFSEEGALGTGRGAGDDGHFLDPSDPWSAANPAKPEYGN